MLVGLLVAAGISLVAFLICGLLPFLAPYAGIIALIVFVFVLLNYAKPEWYRRG